MARIKLARELGAYVISSGPQAGARRSVRFAAVELKDEDAKRCARQGVPRVPRSSTDLFHPETAESGTPSPPHFHEEGNT